MSSSSSAVEEINRPETRIEVNEDDVEAPLFLAVREQFNRMRASGYNQQNGQGMNWCFTLNNYQETEVRAVEFLGQLAGTKWCVYGYEVGTSGTPHLQGYMQFEQNKRLAALRQFVPRAHWEKARGSHQANFVYCTKDGVFKEFGTRPDFEQQDGATRERNRWERIWELAKENRIEQIEAHARITSYGNIKAIAKDYMKEVADAENTTGVWIQGPSGCGKSREARRLYPVAYKKNANKWWDGYQGEDAVILDDLDPGHEVLGHHFKIWMDRYSFIAETKGGAISIRPKKFVVTTQYRIDEIFKDPATREAIKRRCEVIDMFPPQLFPIFVSVEELGEAGPPKKLMRQTAVTEAQPRGEEEEDEVEDSYGLPITSGQKVD